MICIAGKENKVADVLSRIYSNEPEGMVWAKSEYLREDEESEEQRIAHSKAKGKGRAVDDFVTEVHDFEDDIERGLEEVEAMDEEDEENRTPPPPPSKKTKTKQRNIAQRRVPPSIMPGTYILRSCSVF